MVVVRMERVRQRWISHCGTTEGVVTHQKNALAPVCGLW